MSSQGPTTTGSIDAKLTVDDSDFKRGMAEAKADAKEVGALAPEVKVDANVGPALAKLEAVAIAERNLEMAYQRSAIAQEKLDVVTKKYGEDSTHAATARLAMTRASAAETDAETKLTRARQTGTAETEKSTAATKNAAQAQQQSISAIGVLIALAPAVLGAAAPIAAAAVGLGAAFGVMGVSGILAIKGIKDAMEVGDTVGNKYATGLGVLKGDLDQLSATSANKMLGAFSDTVVDLNSRMPFLTQITGEFSTMLGNAGGTAVRGLLGGLEQMKPLLEQSGVELGKFVTWLFSFNGTSGFQQFIGYASQNLPAVMHLLESLVTTAGHLLAAFAPLGPVMLTLLNGLADGLNALPLPVLAGLVTTATTLAPALKMAFAPGVAAMITGVADAIGFTGVMANLAVPVVGILTAVLAGVGMMAATAAAGTQQAAVAATDYAAALEKDNNALGENVRQTIAKKAADEGVFDAASKLGISTQDLTGYLMGNADAAARVKTKMDEARDAATTYDDGLVTQDGAHINSKRQDELQTALDKTTGFLHNNSDALSEQQRHNEQTAEATKVTTGTLDAQTQAAQRSADQYGVTVAMYQTATKTQQTTADQLAQTTFAMQLQGDAAGLLKQAFDALNGNALSLEQAQTRAASATNATTKSFQQNGLAIVGTTDAAIANQTALQNKVTADQAAAEATAKATGSTEQGTAAYKGYKTALEDQLRAHGQLTPAVQDYLDKLYDVNDFKPKPVKLEVDKAKADADIAAFKAWAATVDGQRYTSYIDIITTREDRSTHDPGGTGSAETGGGRANGSMAGGVATGGLIHPGFSASSPAYLADGGFAGGPRGTDTIPAWLTPGEIVMKRSSVNSLGKDNLLHANRTGQWPSQGAQAQLPPIYVQNPFTGEYLLAQVDGRVNAGLGAANQDAGRRPSR